MSKEAFYFSHDYNTREDEKIKDLIFKHGMLGYGIFWAIIEILYQNTNVLRTNYERLAFDLHVPDSSIIKSIIEDFKLFEIDGENFYSLSVERRLQARDEKSQKARESVLKRWNKDVKNTDKNTNVLQSQNETNTIKERKGKERKEYSSRSNDQSNPKISFKKQTKEDFYEELKPLVSDYGKETIKEFFAYWTEPSANGTLKYQLEKTWDTNRRLQNWKRNESKFGVTTIHKQPKQIPGPWAS